MSPSAPLDDTHEDSIEAVRSIRERMIFIRRQIAGWEPRPCPPREEFK
jgi:hypothetical protein